ncbi:MAG: hypothetical protein U0746_15520 [Gemmataceae bacterium]
MRRTLFVLICLPALAVAQRSRQSPERFPETAEPPLANSPEGIKLANVREAAPAAASNVRLTDATAPLVQLTLHAPNAVAVGREVEIRVVVENVSRVAAKNVVIWNALPEGATLLAATPEQVERGPAGPVLKVASLPAGARREIAVKYSPPPGKTEFENHARVTFDHEATARIKVTKPDLKLRKSGPEQASRFDILIFTLDVTNAGLVELTNVAVVDPLPEGLTHAGDPEKPTGAVIEIAAGSSTTPDKRSRTWTIPRLGPGQTRRLEYYVVANDKAVGTVAHGATATAAGLQIDAKSQVAIGEPKLELKVETPPRQQANLPARVTIRLTNRGPRALTNVVVTDRLRNDCTLEAISGGGQQFDSLVQWIVPSIGPNETRALEMSVRQPKGGEVVHDIAAVYRGLTTQEVAKTLFEATPSLAWEVRGSPGSVPLNGEVTYAITVRNTGSAPATNVKPTVMLPPEVQLSKSPQPSGALVEQGKVTFDAVTVAPGARATFLVTAKAIRQGEARVAVELSADVYTKPVQKSGEVTLIGPAEPAAPSGSPLVRPAPPPQRP